MSATAPPQTTRPSARAPSDVLLAVDALTVSVDLGRRHRPLVADVTFEVRPGETLGLVGESGSGKTITSLALTGLLPRNVAVTGGSVTFDGQDLTQLSDRQLRRIRGGLIANIFQEPMTSLNPAFTIGNQIAEMVRAHRKVSRKLAYRRAAEMLDLVGIPSAASRLDDYPHEFSGGMRQRAMIAMALACEPKLLIADEPTTALDVTIQAQILDLLRSLQDELGMAMIFVTHDLGVVADICDRVCVMYAGQVVEQAEVDRFFANPRHPYSEGLLHSMPQAVARGERLQAIPGVVPPPDEMPDGCRFHPRCDYAQDVCRAEPIPLERVGGGVTRCVRHGELDLRGTR